MPELAEDLDNCMINFDRKVVVTNLLDEYGGQLEEIAKTVNDFLTAEEAKGKKYLKTFLLRGLEQDSENEVITVVAADKLKQREQQLRSTHSLLYSAETDGGAKSPPTEFVPLKHISIKLDNLEVKPEKKASAITNGHAQATNGVKDVKSAAKKTGALGAMFKKQETTAATAAKQSPDRGSTKKEDSEKPTGSLGAMFRKQESAATSKKETTATSKKHELAATSKKQGSAATSKKQESAATSKKEAASSKKEAAKKSPDTDKKTKPTPEKTKKSEAASKKGLSGFLSKKDESEKSKASVLKPPTPKKMNEFFKKEDAKKPKLDPNASINLFEESSSSEDEEALDALKREVLTDDDEEKASTSNKRRRIIDSDDEDTGPEVKVERRDEEPEAMEAEDDQANESATFIDEDGFVVTVKAKNKKPAAKSSPAPTPVTIKIKKESPPTPLKKEAASKTPAAKKKQGNIMSFFKKK